MLEYLYFGSLVISLLAVFLVFVKVVNILFPNKYAILRKTDDYNIETYIPVKYLIPFMVVRLPYLSVLVGASDRNIHRGDNHYYFFPYVWGANKDAVHGYIKNYDYLMLKRKTKKVLVVKKKDIRLNKNIEDAHG